MSYYKGHIICHTKRVFLFVILKLYSSLPYYRIFLMFILGVSSCLSHKYGLTVNHAKMVFLIVILKSFVSLTP